MPVTRLFLPTFRRSYSESTDFTMASAWAEEETFVCSVCLETMKDPATLPCGHSYCLRCIQGHWDREKNKSCCSCPQCRQVFNPRPSLSRSTLLVEAMEKLRVSFKQRNPLPPPLPSIHNYLETVRPGTGAPGVAPGRQEGLYPQLPFPLAPTICPRHQRPLDLYCREDEEYVCEECAQCGHVGHCVLAPEAERRAKQKELVQMQAAVQIGLQDTKEDLKEMSLAALQHKASVQALQKESAHLILELRKGLELMGTQVDELLVSHEASLGSRAEGHIHRLEQQAAQLYWRSQEIDKLVDMQDNVGFLKSFHQIEPLVEAERKECALAQQHEALDGIHAALSELQNSVQDLSKESLAKIFRLVNDTTPAQLADGEMDTEGEATHDMSEAAQVNSASAPAITPLPHLPQESLMATAENTDLKPKTREDMLKYRCEPTMDPNTAFRHILLSEGGCKATLRLENQNPAVNPERFQFWRQVFCREPLSGSPFYWEVEWTGLKITIGVAYKEMERKTSDDQSRLGHNASSWSLYWSGTDFSFWCGGQETRLGSRKARRIGVYLDQSSGVLAFYRIANSHAHLIHLHQTQFNGPLYPGFRFGSGSGASVQLCQLE
ncbi:E3 ubiquitin/ISG15 ligase TRIM25-like isoform X2 [Gadus chalcogrammus]|nr:E3 ubiquitin/ISG15 ligase TRIM25-like isoform X2 [Gadus chalcogrammus]XP_056467627.1 E3 ubiquitin/ISG15 ligase TRIM25-like isoform X2 [Gadus chalcogrammus]